MAENTEEVKSGQSIVSMMKRPGRKPKFDSADSLWDKFVEYCEWVDSNPWQVKTASNAINSSGGKQGNAMRQEVRVLQRAYTLQGFCAYAGINKWADFKRNNERDYETNPTNKRFNYLFDTIDAIENAVCSQQIDGAMINQFSGALVARLNGIADKQINEVTGKDGKPFEFPKLSNDDIDELRKLHGL